jgi:hypothetical protein
MAEGLLRHDAGDRFETFSAELSQAACGRSQSK